MGREQRLGEVFVELADTLVEDLDVIELLQTLCERSVELLQADAAVLLLADQQGVLQVAASTSTEARVLFVLQTEEGPCLDCFTSGDQMVNIDLDEVAQRWPRFRTATSKIGYHSTHALPLRLRDEAVGVLNLLCLDRPTLAQEDITLGQALCDVATIGLLQERAVRLREELAEQLQSALNSRVLVEQAKGVLSALAGVSVAEAFTVMRDYARNNHVHLRDVALAVIDGQLPAAKLIS